MKPAPFQYHAPTTVEEAVGLLAELGDEAKVLAGGQSLVPMLNLRLARFEHLVDIGRIEALRGSERRNGSLVVGAATRDSMIEFDPTVAAAVPLLSAVTPYIGHFQIRNRGTIGGSLAHADPAAEYPAVAVALDATFDVVSSTGSRTVPAADFFDGVWSTSLEDGELLRSISFPVWAGRCGFGVAEFARRHGDFAIAGAVAAVELGPDDAVVRSALSIFGVAGTPTRATSTETGVAGRPSAEIDPDEVGRSAMDAIEDVSDDPQVPSDYRRRIGAAMVADAWRRAVDDAHHDGSPR
ncbi:MAG: xanthine dehydrogenase family protein subunit M [Ilumatobacteraceae bacterium]